MSLNNPDQIRPEISPDQRRALTNDLWDKLRRAANMAGGALLDYAEATRGRDASIAGEIVLAVAAVIEKRLR